MWFSAGAGKLFQKGNWEALPQAKELRDRTNPRPCMSKEEAGTKLDICFKAG